MLPVYNVVNISRLPVVYLALTFTDNESVWDFIDTLGEDSPVYAVYCDGKLLATTNIALNYIEDALFGESE
jgi:hypothetical protein